MRKIVHRDGHAEGVVYMDEKGEETMQPADLVFWRHGRPTVCACCYLSGIGDPYDPETGNGTLGMNLTHQVGGGERGNAGVRRAPEPFHDRVARSDGASDFDGDLVEDVPEGILRGGMFEGGADSGLFSRSARSAGFRRERLHGTGAGSGRKLRSAIGTISGPARA